MKSVDTKLFMWGMLAGAIAYHLVKSTSIQVDLLKGPEIGKLPRYE